MNHYLYCVTVGCPACGGVSQFVVTTENEVGLMQDVPILKSHCPECGVQVDAIDDWDLRAEHEIQTVDAVTSEEPEL